jgi:L-seryl-tRNA(Ser) seleniumtransferase
VGECASQIGSGALPVETLPSIALVITPENASDAQLRALGQALRELPVPMIGRIHSGSLLLDLRCLENEQVFLEQLPHLRTLLG